MELTLVRFAFSKIATIGALLVDGVPGCFVLEDADRLMAGLPKLKGRTAIPSGSYALRISWSPRFRRELPEIADVEGFTGVRIHWGNKPEDTEGCLLVGERPDVHNWMVLDSRKAFAAMYSSFRSSNRITIVRAPGHSRLTNDLRRAWIGDYNVVEA